MCLDGIAGLHVVRRQAKTIVYASMSMPEAGTTAGVSFGGCEPPQPSLFLNNTNVLGFSSRPTPRGKPQDLRKIPLKVHNKAIALRRQDHTVDQRSDRLPCLQSSFLIAKGADQRADARDTSRTSRGAGAQGPGQGRATVPPRVAPCGGELTRAAGRFPLRSDPCSNGPLLWKRGQRSDRHGATECDPTLGVAGSAIHSGDHTADWAVAQ